MFRAYPIIILEVTFECLLLKILDYHFDGCKVFPFIFCKSLGVSSQVVTYTLKGDYLFIKHHNQPTFLLSNAFLNLLRVFQCTLFDHPGFTLSLAFYHSDLDDARVIFVDLDAVQYEPALIGVLRPFCRLLFGHRRTISPVYAKFLTASRSVRRLE